MSRLFLIVLYFGAEVFDHSVGYLWQANLPEGGSNDDHSESNVSGEDAVHGADYEDGFGRNESHPEGKSWVFEWWRIRGTAEYIFGRSGTKGGTNGNDNWFSTPEGTGRMSRDAGWVTKYRSQRDHPSQGVLSGEDLQLVGRPRHDICRRR